MPTSRAPAAIAVQGLRKSFGDHVVLDGIDLVPVAWMPGALRWFAANQPFSPIIETLRGLLTGTAIGSDGAVAVAWCVGIAVGGFAWSRSLFNRDPVR
jgi:ABC-2 type transport system permease protein